MKRCLACDATFEGRGWRCPTCGRAPEEREGVPLFAPELTEGGGQDADYRIGDILAAEATHFWFRGRRELIAWALQAHFGDARRAFEIGCGTGFVLEAMRKAVPGLEVAASDVLSRGLEAARRRVPGAEIVQVDARRLPYRDEFDVIGAFDVLEHVDEDERVLEEAARALRARGGLLLTVPQHPWLWSAVDEFSRHRRRYTRADLVAKVRRAGFEVLRATSFFSFSLPLQALARLRGPRRVEDLDPTTELRIAAPVNVLLRGLTGIEQALIRAGVSLPLGGSLFVAARKAA